MNTALSLNYTTLSQTPFSNPNKTHHSLFSTQLPKHKSLSFHVKIPSGSPILASKTPTEAEISLLQMEKVDLDDEFDADFEEDDEDAEDEEDEDIIVPLQHMREWTKNKPPGFGEGKVYDTVIEDKLMEEIEQSRAAQRANVDNLKKSLEDNSNSSKKDKILKQKVSEVAPDGVRVRLVNLPKKKNIHRDLQAAFKGVSGIVNIVPAVLGNEKTREPVCKGFAFIDFKSEKDANRFVDTFSAQPVAFGKLQKAIKCEILRPNSPNTASVPVKPSLRSAKNPPLLSNSRPEIDSNPVLDPFVEDSAFDKFKNGDDNNIGSATEEYDDANLGSRSTLDDSKQETDVSEIGSKSLKRVEEKGKKKKKTTKTKRKGEKTPKPSIPGSANRLKIKEKALLSGVFSKYGVNSAMAAEGQS